MKKRAVSATPLLLGVFVGGAALGIAFEFQQQSTKSEPTAKTSPVSVDRRIDDRSTFVISPSELVTQIASEALKGNDAIPFSTEQLESARPVSLSSLGFTESQIAASTECLTAAIYYEAGFQPLSERRAVAQVVLNRVRHPAFPTSVCAVVYEGSDRRTGCQFTFTCDGSLLRTPSDRAWLEAEKIARAVLRGEVEPAVGMATHYHAEYVLPYWAYRLTKISQLGPHIFYRWNGSWGRRSSFRQRPTSDETVEVAVDLPAAKPSDVDEQDESVVITPPLGRSAVIEDDVDALSANIGGEAGLPKTGSGLVIADEKRGVLREDQQASGLD